MSQPTVGISTTVVRFSELDSLMPGRLPTHKHRHQPALSETKHRSGANPHLGELPHRLGRERQKGGFTGLGWLYGPPNVPLSHFMALRRCSDQEPMKDDENEPPESERPSPHVLVL